MPVAWNAWDSCDDDSVWPSWHEDIQSNSLSFNTNWNTCNWKDEFLWKASSRRSYWSNQEEQQEILNKLPTYTELEAEEVILYILENQVPSDPKDQYKQMVRNGMFK